MTIINKLFKKKYILLTLMFRSYGMDGPNQVNRNTQNINTGNLLELPSISQINTENSLELSSIQQEINSMKKKEFDNFVKIIKCRIDKIEDLFISIMKNYCFFFEETVYSMKTDYKNIKDFIEKANVNYDVEKNTINQNTFKIPETFIKKIIKIFIELSAYYKDKYNTNTFPEDFETLNTHIRHYLDTMEEYFVFISLDNYVYNNFDNNLLENVLALYEFDNNSLKNVLSLYEKLNIIDDLSLTEKEKFLLKKIKDLIMLRVKIFNSENNKKENIKPLYIEALNKLKKNPKDIHRNKFTKYIILQKRMFVLIDPQKKKQKYFIENLKTLLDNIYKHDSNDLKIFSYNNIKKIITKINTIIEKKNIYDLDPQNFINLFLLNSNKEIKGSFIDEIITIFYNQIHNYLHNKTIMFSDNYRRDQRLYYYLYIQITKYIIVNMEQYIIFSHLKYLTDNFFIIFANLKYLTDDFFIILNKDKNFLKEKNSLNTEEKYILSFLKYLENARKKITKEDLENYNICTIHKLNDTNMIFLEKEEKKQLLEIKLKLKAEILNGEFFFIGLEEKDDTIESEFFYDVIRILMLKTYFETFRPRPDFNYERDIVLRANELRPHEKEREITKKSIEIFLSNIISILKKINNIINNNICNNTFSSSYPDNFMDQMENMLNTELIELSKLSPPYSELHILKRLILPYQSKNKQKTILEITFINIKEDTEYVKQDIKNNSVEFELNNTFSYSLIEHIINNLEEIEFSNIEEITEIHNLIHSYIENIKNFIIGFENLLSQINFPIEEYFDSLDRLQTHNDKEFKRIKEKIYKIKKEEIYTKEKEINLTKIDMDNSREIN